jgi:hypothetical protein
MNHAALMSVVDRAREYDQKPRGFDRRLHVRGRAGSQALSLDQLKRKELPADSPTS